MRLGGLGFLSLQGVGEADGLRQSVFESVSGKVSRQGHSEVSKGTQAMTLGLETLTWNCCALTLWVRGPYERGERGRWEGCGMMLWEWVIRQSNHGFVQRSNRALGPQVLAVGLGPESYAYTRCWTPGYLQGNWHGRRLEWEEEKVLKTYDL